MHTVGRGSVTVSRNGKEIPVFPLYIRQDLRGGRGVYYYCVTMALEGFLKLKSIIPMLLR